MGRKVPYKLTRKVLYKLTRKGTLRLARKGSTGSVASVMEGGTLMRPELPPAGTGGRKQLLGAVGRWPLPARDGAHEAPRPRTQHSGTLMKNDHPLVLYLLCKKYQAASGQIDHQ